MQYLHSEDKMTFCTHKGSVTKGADLAVLLRVGLSSLRNQLLASFKWLKALKSHDKGQPIDAQPNSAVQLIEYTVHMSSHKLTTLRADQESFYRIGSRDVRPHLVWCMVSPSHAIFFRPFIGPQIT